MNLSTLEKSLFWQRYVLNHTRNPTQKERVRRAIAKLEAEIQHMKGKQ